MLTLDENLAPIWEPLRAAQYYATGTQSIPTNGNSIILFPNTVTTSPFITYLNGTFTVTKYGVGIITASIPFTSTSARRCVFVQKNETTQEFGEQCVNDIPASVESLSTTAILNFVPGDTFRIRSTTTTATATTFSASTFAHVQILLV